MLKNITLSADEELIRRARAKAHSDHTTLNEAFRWWLARYVQSEQTVAEYTALMEQLSYAEAGRHFSRDELNER